MANDQIARWRLILEEFGPEHRHIAGKDNVVADALSQLDRQEDLTDAETCTQVCRACYMAGYTRDESIEVQAEPNETDYCYVVN